MKLLIIKTLFLTSTHAHTDLKLPYAQIPEFGTGDKIGMKERAVTSEEILGTRNYGVLVPALTLTLILPFL